MRPLHRHPWIPATRIETIRLPRPRFLRPHAAVVVPVIVAGLVVTGIALMRDGDDAAKASRSARGSGERPVIAGPGSTYVAAHLRANGVVVSDQWLVYPRPVRLVELAATPTTIAGRRDRPWVRLLSVAADGRPVALPPWSHRRSAARSVVFPDGARSIHLRYALFGTVRRSDPVAAPAGRALVLLNAVRLSPRRPHRSQTWRITGGDVTSLSCRTSGDVFVACGNERPGGWTVQIAASRPFTKVLAQVELGG